MAITFLESQRWNNCPILCIYHLVAKGVFDARLSTNYLKLSPTGSEG